MEPVSLVFNACPCVITWSDVFVKDRDRLVKLHILTARFKYCTTIEPLTRPVKEKDMSELDQHQMKTDTS